MRTSNTILYEKVNPIKNIKVKNLFSVLIFLLLGSMPVYRITSLHHNNSHNDDIICWIMALLCELWFTFYWLLCINNKWNPVEYKTYPNRLLQCLDESDLPAVDMFVTTADPELEPPIMTVNTVISLLAVDYPPNKLACYVSDDGCSPIILYSLVEASKFAKLWVPFCKKHNVQVRAPFKYFENTPNNSDPRFDQEWKDIKDEYDRFSWKIETATMGKKIPNEVMRSDEFEVFSNVEPRNHGAIIKVVLDEKQMVLPQLVYISREKRPNVQHHFKAGAMNVLSRVSGVMSNAPFMVNVDCDMFVNDPQVVLRGMCLLVGPTLADSQRNRFAFAQFPQLFYDALPNDPFGNQMVVLFEYGARGVAGLQGAFYSGTGCFHRRKVIYGQSPPNIGHNSNNNNRDQIEVEVELELRDRDRIEVASWEYEVDTRWGTKVGWLYGSATEDILTSITIHKRGWGSAICWPDPPGFLGCAPTSGPVTLIQQKRWITGLLEILFSKHCPLYMERLHWRQCLAYVWAITWGFRSIAEHIYAHLIARAIITNSQLFPKSNEPTFYMAIGFFILYNVYTLSEYWGTGQSARAWWNNQKMGRVNSMGAWVLGVLSVVLKLLGVSETVFEVTKKTSTTASDSSTAPSGIKFTFDDSPAFVVLATLLLVQLAALSTVLLGAQPALPSGGQGSGILEVVCCAWLVLCLWPILKGLFGKGMHGIPSYSLLKSIFFALLFLLLCLGTSVGPN